MPEFTIHTLPSAPAASRALLQRLQEQVGFVPNLAATMAESPTLLEAFLTLRAIAAKGALDPVAREIVSIAVASDTGCDYCVAAHTTFALKQGAPGSEVEAVRAGGPPADARLRALAAFARATTQRRHDVRERAQDLLAQGLTPSHVLDVLAVIAVPMLASSVHALAGVALDPLFQAQEWAAPA